VKWSSWNRSSQLSFLYDFSNSISLIKSFSFHLGLHRVSSLVLFSIDFLRHFFRTKFCFKDLSFFRSLSLVKLEWPDELDGGLGLRISLRISIYRLFNRKHGTVKLQNTHALFTLYNLLDYYLIEGFFFSSVASWKPF
jgi:hypothetical protein